MPVIFSTLAGFVNMLLAPINQVGTAYWPAMLIGPQLLKEGQVKNNNIFKILYLK